MVAVKECHSNKEVCGKTQIPIKQWDACCQKGESLLVLFTLMLLIGKNHLILEMASEQTLELILKTFSCLRKKTKQYCCFKLRNQHEQRACLSSH